MKFSLTFLIVFGIKMMLFPCYYSTDLEVHLNWKRITQTQHIENWYFDTQSEWTLDYPPLFAYFEYILAFIGSFFSIDFNINSKPQKNTVIFLRWTVILSDLIYYYTATYVYKKIYPQGTSTIRQFLICAPFGLILIDNIHFQYNGMLKALLLISCLKLQQKEYIQSAILFTILLSFKHIYIYVAPVFFFILLRNYCFIGQNFKLQNLIILGSLCLSVMCLVFLPFLQIDQLKQIISRLFPINRGLVHAYWAPNFWALYCFIDRILGFIYQIMNRKYIRTSDLVGGKVQITAFEFLPQVSALATNIVVIIFSLILWKFIFMKNKIAQKNVFKCALVQSIIFYNFGYHVHEKAIMIPLILLLLERNDSNITFMASWVNSLSLLPLIPSVTEQPLLFIMLILYHFLLYIDLKESQNLEITSFENKYIACGIMIFIFQFIQPLLLARLSFLPLMAYSIYSALFNQYWLITEIKSLNNLKEQKYELL